MNKKGISLIALVVTIIVLLILATISVSIILGPDGIIEQSKASKLDHRYATIKDKIDARENALYMSFEQGKSGELDQAFINRLKAEGLVFEGEDDYDQDSRILKLGKTNTLEKPYTYELHVMDGSLEGKEIADAIKELPDSSKDENLKHLTFSIKTTSANQNVILPISNANGLEVQWDVENNSSIVPVSGSNPNRTYPIPGTYKIKIKGTVQGESTFGGNTSFPIHELIYWGENNFTTFENIGKSLTGTIPYPSRNSFTEATSFYQTFRACTNLTGTIPKNLFANAPKVESFELTFAYCFELKGGIPKVLFNNCSNVTSFVRVFNMSTLTGKIPENLFKNCKKVQYFSGVFSDMPGLTGSIPENLFANCPDAIYFNNIFYRCTGLTGAIPANLFKNCTKAIDFEETFAYCWNLTSVPENIFDNCPNVVNFNQTFRSCEGLIGKAPQLWTRTNVTYYTGCFFRCHYLTNLDSAPTGWKQI